MVGVLVDNMSTHSKLSGKQWLAAHRALVQRKHVFYIISTRCSCDTGVYKVGSSRDGAQRLRAHLNSYCSGIHLHYIRTFKRRAHNMTGPEPAAAFESLFKRNLRQLGLRPLRGTEFFKTSLRVLNTALSATEAKHVVDSEPVRRTGRQRRTAQEWWLQT